MTHVKGIGGVFIDSEAPAVLAGWYQAVLGVTMESHPDGESFYCVFPTRDIETSIVRENPVFAINRAKRPLAGHEARGFVLNLRVDDLANQLAKLRARGDVEIEEKVIEWERGKHAWIRDLDGNRVELYEEVLPEA